jgi:hypothetical protein
MSLELPREVIYEIMEYMEPDVILKFIRTNSVYYEYYKQNKKKIIERYIDKYNIDYKDPTNFIYIKNNVRQNWYREDYKDIDSEYDLDKIFKLYMRYYDKKKIECDYMYSRGICITKNRRMILKYDEINVNRKSVRGWINYRYNTPDDEDYDIQQYIIKLKKRIKRYGGDDKMNCIFRRQIIDAFKALLLLDYYDIENRINDGEFNNDYNRNEWRSTENNEIYEYRPIFAEESHITSIPIYPNLEELDCRYQYIKYIPAYPKLKLLNCSGCEQLRYVSRECKELEIFHGMSCDRLRMDINHFMKIRVNKVRNGYTNIF